ncbi:MAG TPA: protein translocase subunit SecF [Candidatus Nanoarchaeia archaeon]|nr:protein translocase subunit SecF [uncultured archaeon]
MLKIVKKRNWFFAFSLFLIVPGLVSLFLWGLNLGIDFTGGTLLELQFKRTATQEEITQTGSRKNIEISTIQTTGENTYLLRTKPLDEEETKGLIEEFNQSFPGAKELRRETIGPTIGRELLIKSLTALVVASITIVLYIAWAFRSVPKPASSWRFGATAIITLLHDVLILVGAFSILGHFLAVEVDSLFVTAALTVIGFSVHDTIVVFDRIRENLNRGQLKDFEETVEHSLMQTIGRSINTSLTVVLVLLSLLLFGGASIRWFVVALLIGIISGTYSSIFNAAPLLVVWQKFVERKNK